MSRHFNQRSSSSTRQVVAIGLSMLVLLSILPNSLLAQTERIPEGYSTTILQVRFKPGTPISDVRSRIPAGVLASAESVQPLFPLPVDRLDGLRSQAMRAGTQVVPDPRLWFQVTLEEGTDAVAAIRELRAHPAVDVVEPAPLPSPDPAITPDFTDMQGYLGPATDGIDAEYAWLFPGGTGAGVKVYDVEYEWNQNHEDLTKAAGVTLLVLPGDSPAPPFNDNNHGTAVLGELIADNDTKGVTGIVYDADIGLAPQRTANLGQAVGTAVLLAAIDGNVGDVILMETQTSVCDLGGCNSDTQDGCGPSEWVQSTFDAVWLATAAGRIVVSAAGNGSVNLDQEACDDKFDRNERDSGAIIVGAGQPPGSSDREKRSSSSYGSRVDVQGWGTGVMTTGYGSPYVDPDDPTNPNKWYAQSFSGTSSASPIVTGAAAALQGINKAVNGSALNAFQIRDILVATGSPQQGNTAQHIGPRPNLGLAIAEIINVPPVADAGSDQTVECAAHDGTEVTLDGSGSFDNNGDVLTYTWTGPFPEGGGTVNGVGPAITLELGSHEIILTVDDGNGETDMDTVQVDIVDTTDPVLTLNGDATMTLECGIDEYVEPGWTVTDICDPSPNVGVVGAVDVGTPGSYELTYTATDASGNTDEEIRTVDVIDTTPPDITINSDPISLWPPNSSYRSVSLDSLDTVAADACDETVSSDDIVIASSSSDEAENGKGDGNTVDDMVITSCRDVDLRAERAQNGNGRVYTLWLEVADASDNVGTAEYTAHSPANVASGPLAVDDGPVYSVTGCDPLAASDALAASGNQDLESVAKAPELPDEYALSQNYPNPFNPTTTIRFDLPEEAQVMLTVHDMLGRTVATLVDTDMPGGSHRVRWDATGFPSGPYLLQIRAGAFRMNRQMTLVK